MKISVYPSHWHKNLTKRWLCVCPNRWQSPKVQRTRFADQNLGTANLTTLARNYLHDWFCYVGGRVKGIMLEKNVYLRNLRPMTQYRLWKKHISHNHDVMLAPIGEILSGEYRTYVVLYSPYEFHSQWNKTLKLLSQNSFIHSNRLWMKIITTIITS